MKIPEHTFSNGLVTVRLYLPDPKNGYYRGPRFDWSSMVHRIEYAGHTFFGPWNPESGDPEGHDSNALGLASEFGMKTPLGFDAARPGETFLKIGVGGLEKSGDGAAYGFWNRYRVLRPAAWTVSPDKDGIRFAQTAANPGTGHGYRYEKEMRLLPGRPVFVTRHRLVNTGREAIVTDHYCHHFSHMDDAPLGPDYRVTFPFPAAPKAPMTEGATLANGRLTLAAPLAPGKTIYAELTGLTGRASDHGARVENLKTAAGYTLKGDTAPSHVNLWGMSNVVCPEPFVAINLAPGREMRWQTEYTFFAPAPPG